MTFPPARIEPLVRGISFAHRMRSNRLGLQFNLWNRFFAKQCFPWNKTYTHIHKIAVVYNTYYGYKNTQSPTQTPSIMSIFPLFTSCVCQWSDQDPNPDWRRGIPAWYEGSFSFVAFVRASAPEGTLFSWPCPQQTTWRILGPPGSVPSHRRVIFRTIRPWHPGRSESRKSGGRR